MMDKIDKFMEKQQEPSFWLCSGVYALGCILGTLAGYLVMWKNVAKLCGYVL